MRITFLGNFQVDYSSESHHANTLQALGHEVVRLQENRTDPTVIGRQAQESDLFVWIHTHGWPTDNMDQVLASLRQNRIPSLTYHLDLWMGLARQRDIRNGPYWDIDHFFTVDKLMADWLNANTPVKGHFLPAGVYEPDCYISTEPSKFANDVVFVGSKRYHREWPWRPKLIDWLRRTYKDRFTHIGPGGITSLRGDDLNRMYANSKVAVGDTLCKGFCYPHYTSDRLFEAPGRGGFQIFPEIVGVRDWFPEDTLDMFTFGDFTGLKAMIDRYLEDDTTREAMRVKAHQHVKANHTYTQRWESILGSLTC